MKLISRSPLCTLLFVLATIRHADEPASTLRVFYTGHSFHMFVPERMSRLTEAAGVDAYKLVGTQSLGGSRVEQHWNLPDEQNQAKKILESAGADVFTMAPNVQMPDVGIEQFAELGLKHNPKLRLLVQESWVPGDYLDKRVTSNAQRDEIDLAKLRTDQATWRGQMETQAKAFNAKAGREAVSIVPVGDAVVKLRELVAQGKVPGIAKQSELFNDTIGHANPPILMLTAYCNFACITGSTPVGLKVNEEGISDELNAMLQQIAWKTVIAYPTSGVRPPTPNPGKADIRGIVTKITPIEDRPFLCRLIIEGEKEEDTAHAKASVLVLKPAKVCFWKDGMKVEATFDDIKVGCKVQCTFTETATASVPPSGRTDEVLILESTRSEQAPGDGDAP